MIRVLIVDDSAVIRALLSDILGRQPDMKVVGAAPDPYVARDMVLSLNPDVITLDVNMPKMDGITFLEKLMRRRPIPVVMFSALTAKGADVTMKALSLGAVDYVTKPEDDIRKGVQALSETLTKKVRCAAAARVRLVTGVPALPRGGGAIAPNIGRPDHVLAKSIICIGASTGGAQAIESLIVPLPPGTPGIVVTQHMPSRFTQAFAKRVDQLTALEVVEAEDGMRVKPGRVIIAPGNRHLVLQGSAHRCHVSVKDGPEVNFSRPSVDVLFRSAANVAKGQIIGVLLTGMGKDGAKGLKLLRDSGALTIAQDEASCVVFGMPKAAIALDAADHIWSLDQIAAALQKIARLSHSHSEAHA